MIDISRNDGSASCYFFADEFGSYFVLKIGSEGVSFQSIFPFSIFDPLFAFLVFTNGDELHLGSDDSLFGVMHLGDILSWFRA